MKREEWEEFIDFLRDNVRLHAGYFSCRSNRDVEEVGVVQLFHESLGHNGNQFFCSYRSRGRGNDPPDCEALSRTGQRIGIEVTELVDGESIATVESGAPIQWRPFSTSHLFGVLAERIAKKDSPLDVKGGPYDEYVLVIYCDEPRVLDYGPIEYIKGATFPQTRLIDRAFLLFSYSPCEGCCPYIELKLIGA